MLINLEVVVKKINEHRFLIYAKDFDLCFSGISEDDAIKNLLAGIELYTKETVDNNYPLNKLLFPGTDSFDFAALERASHQISCTPLKKVFNNILTIQNIILYRKEEK